MKMNIREMHTGKLDGWVTEPCFAYKQGKKDALFPMTFIIPIRTSKLWSPDR